MTVVLEAAPLVPAVPQGAPHDDATQTLENIIAAHRQALVDLAPHQAWRSVRVDTGWHMEHLGLLLCLRDGGGARRCGDEAMRGTGRERDTELSGLNGVAEGHGPG